MKCGLKEIMIAEVALNPQDRVFIWLAQDTQERPSEWATYISRDSDPNTTVLGHYFSSRGAAYADFIARLNHHRFRPSLG